MMKEDKIIESQQNIESSAFSRQELLDRISALEENLLELQQDNTWLTTENMRLSHDCFVLRESDFWKVTKPMRTVLDEIKKGELGGAVFRMFQTLKKNKTLSFSSLKKWISFSGVSCSTPFLRTAGPDVSNRSALTAIDSDFQAGISSRKIIFLSHELSLTGAPLVLLNFAKAAKSLGYYVLFASPVDGPLNVEIEKADIPLLIIPDLFHKAYLAEMCSSFDLAVANTVVASGAINALNGSDTPVLWWLHDAAGSYIDASPYMPAQIEDNIHVYCVCDYIVKYLKMFYSYNNVRLLSYYMEEMKLSDTTVAPELPDTTGKTVFSFVGTMVFRKGHDILAAAIRALPDEVREKCLFVIVSRGAYKPFAKVTKQLCRDYPDSVVHFDFLDRDRMGALYDATDCLICSSRDDPMPCVITEMLSLGKPVISTEFTGYASILAAAGSGLIYRRNSPVQLSECITSFVSDAALRESLSSRARETYENNFSLPVFTENIRKILDELIPGDEDKSISQ